MLIERSRHRKVLVKEPVAPTPNCRRSDRLCPRRCGSAPASARTIPTTAPGGGEPKFPRYVPVTPRLCLHFDISGYGGDEATPDFTTPPKGTVRIATISAGGARRINRAVVQCAEEIVISSEQLESVEKLVRKYATYPRSETLP
jgi:hypothetical protein